jgi:hypothetical protein
MALGDKKTMQLGAPQDESSLYPRINIGAIGWKTSLSLGMNLNRMKLVFRRGFSADFRMGQPPFSGRKRKQKGNNKAFPKGNQRELFVYRSSMPFWVFSRKS